MLEYEIIDDQTDKEIQESMYYIKLAWLICNGIIVILAMVLFICIYCYRKIDNDDLKGETKSSSKKSDSTKSKNCEFNKLDENLIKNEENDIHNNSKLNEEN